MSKDSGDDSYDKERGGFTEVAANIYLSEDAPDQVIAKRFGSLGPLLSKLFDSGVEARGVERVPESQRDPKNLWNSLFLWWSVNFALLGVPIGTLGQFAFTLTLPHVIATTFCFGALGSIAMAFIATLGPKTGLRTMIIVRYSSGYVGGIFYSVLNIITAIGFAITAAILGGQTLASIDANKLPLIVGIILISVCCLIPCFVGYDLVHVYERYAWIATLFVMCCIFGLGGQVGYDLSAQKPFEDTGKALRADVLSFGSVVFGSFAGWAPVAADYNVRLPADTNPHKVFALTFLGIFIPVVFTLCLGGALMTITDPAYVAAFGASGDTGALIAQVLAPWGGGGKFLLVVLALGMISINIPNTYSAALCIQALGRPFAMIPRFVWVIVVFVVYTIASIAGRAHLSAILNNLLSTLSYWTAFFIVIVAEEHFIFRRKGGPLGGYNLADWDNPSKLPMGIAGMLAACFGIVGAVLGMSQVWYTGPIGKTVGADLGFELAASFSAITFPLLRWMEIRLTGR